MKLLINNNSKWFPNEIDLKELIFYIVFTLHCLIGGALAFWGLPFSPFYTSVIVLVFLFLYRLKLDIILKFHIGFIFLIVLSGIINGSSIKDFLIGIRLPIISYTMYIVVDNFFGRGFKFFIRVVKVLAFLQLPVVISQLLFSETLISLSAISTKFHDIRYGTFFVKSDPIMSLFLVMMVVYLLFRVKKKSLWDIVVLVSSSLTVFLASSKVLQLILLLILGYFFFSYSNFKQKIYSSVIAIALASIVIITGYHQNLFYQFNQLYASIAGDQERQVRKFIEGDYARMGAIIYFLNEPVKVFGDGPGSYTNPFSGSMDLGLTGSNFKMYAEYGIVGLAYSIYGIFLIVFAKLKSGIHSYFIILSLLALSMTSDIYNHASLMFVFYLVLYIHESISTKDLKILLAK